ncbi:MAG: hypothetical protein HY901_23690 [Deltaproteobacteria bacterium]|nr:hypothetical protein [Deltaproteobacteria bacterium]
MTGGFLVSVELLRVQTFLFAVPRLAAMVGANVLIGEELRLRLPQLAKACGATLPAPIIYSPRLGCSDPLDALAVPDELQDAPSRLLGDGILARDGGHFRAVFIDADKAENFRRRAQTRLLTRLPGLRFEIRSGPIDQDETVPLIDVRERSILEIPQIQVCEESGNGAARVFEERRLATESGEQLQRVAISTGVRLRGAAYSRFREGKSRDLIGLLQPGLPLQGPGHTLKTTATLGALAG